MKKLSIALSLVVFSLAAVEVHAASGVDTVKSRINEVLAVLKDPALKGDAAKDIKQKRLRAIFDNTFDYAELSRATLSRYWDKLNPEQQKEFMQLYKTLLEKLYMGEILAYKDQQIVVGKERPLGENRVEVDTKVISEKTETPINFRLIFKNNQWWSYDFVIENISVVANYRSQFGRILAKDSIEKMLEDLRAKAA
jgi:phospholipid transport system substrate-binding protein